MVIYPLCILHTGLPQVAPYAIPLSMLMGSLLWGQSRHWWRCLLARRDNVSRTRCHRE
jgi:hypothetical protein